MIFISTMLTIVCFGDLRINKVSVSVLDKWTLKIKIKHRYNCTDSALMNYVIDFPHRVAIGLIGNFYTCLIEQTWRP